jgi:hypothetical protein
LHFIPIVILEDCGTKHFRTTYLPANFRARVKHVDAEVTFLKMMVPRLRMTPEGAPPFVDVPSGYWAELLGE